MITLLRVTTRLAQVSCVWLAKVSLRNNPSISCRLCYVAALSLDHCSRLLIHAHSTDCTTSYFRHVKDSYSLYCSSKQYVEQCLTFKMDSIPYVSHSEASFWLPGYMLELLDACSIVAYHSLIHGKGLQETTLHHTYAAAVNGCVV